MTKKAQKAIAAIVAMVTFTYGALVLWSIGPIAWEFADAGSGGIGAVSAGLFEGVVPVATGAVANRVLAGWARRAGTLVQALHRAHSIVLLIVAGLVVLAVILVSPVTAGTDARLWMGFALVVGLAIAAQSIALALMLAFFVAEDPARSRMDAT